MNDTPAPLADARRSRLVFLGTKDFAVPSFEYLCNQGFQVLALITQPDRPQGRKQEIIPANIRLSAENRGLPVYQPEDLNAPEGLALLESLSPNLLVTVAYGQILKPATLASATFGGVNLHGSLLPKYRGAAPVARAMQSGDAETGVTVIQMSPLVDAGGILGMLSTEIKPDETAATLEARLGEMGAPLLAQSLTDFMEGRGKPEHQDKSLATRAPKLTKEESFVNWSQPATLVDRFIRAMNPWPLARSRFIPADGRPGVNVLFHLSAVAEGLHQPSTATGIVIQSDKSGIAVSCGDGRAVLIKTIQTEGRKTLPAIEWARGSRVTAGDQFVSSPL
ncbi:MAG: methionyl-tRNA formyltransferase [Isosphaeraceae bacterium]